MISLEAAAGNPSGGRRLFLSGNVDRVAPPSGDRDLPFGSISAEIRAKPPVRTAHGDRGMPSGTHLRTVALPMTGFVLPPFGLLALEVRASVNLRRRLIQADSVLPFRYRGAAPAGRRDRIRTFTIGQGS